MTYTGVVSPDALFFFSVMYIFLALAFMTFCLVRCCCCCFINKPRLCYAVNSVFVFGLTHPFCCLGFWFPLLLTVSVIAPDCLSVCLYIGPSFIHLYFSFRLPKYQKYHIPSLLPYLLNRIRYTIRDMRYRTKYLSHEGGRQTYGFIWLAEAVGFCNLLGFCKFDIRHLITRSV